MELLTIDKPELVIKYMDKAEVISTGTIDNEIYIIRFKIEGISYKCDWFIEDAGIDHLDQTAVIEYAFSHMYTWTND